MKFVLEVGLAADHKPDPQLLAADLQMVLANHNTERGFRCTDYAEWVTVRPNLKGNVGRPQATQPGSVHDQISKMAVGERKYIETTADGYAQVQREWNLPASRRNALTKDIVLKCSVWTCVGHGVGNVRILVCVERTK